MEMLDFNTIKPANLPVNAIVRLPHPRGGDNQVNERFLAPLLIAKPATMTQSAETTIPPY